MFGNKFDFENVVPQKVSKDIESYTFMLYAPPKFGKTTFCYKLFGKKAYFARTEKGTKLLAGLHGGDITSWSDMILMKSSLQQYKMKHGENPYEVIVIDTVDNLWGFLETYVCNKYGVSPTDINKANGGYGKGYKEMSYEWFTVFKEIEDLGITLCFISHAKKKMEKLTINGKEEEYEKFVPSIQERGLEVIAKMVDSILFAYLTVDENGKQVQALYTRETLQFQAGSRFSSHMPPSLPYTPMAYKEAMLKALDEIEKELGSDLMKEERESNSLQESDAEFDKVMAEVQELGNKLYSLGRLHELEEIAEKCFGEGAKITGATPKQLEQLVLALEEIKLLVA